MRNLSLYERANLFNQAFPQLCPLSYHDGVIQGIWWLGGARHSDFYGSYHKNYLDRIQSMFSDATKVVHLFSGSLPYSPTYTRIGMGEGEKPDIIGNAENLASFLPFKPDLIYADPPYSVEDSEHYKTGLINRNRVIKECTSVLQRGGFIVWLDQALPTFSNDEIKLVGLIGYIRSTANRFRVVSIFRKP
jgi:hypothetical protein